MKQLFLSLTLFVITTSFAQQLSGKVPGVTISKPYSANDTVIKVIYNKPRILPNKKPAFYINGTLVNQNILRTLNQTEIETMTVDKEEFKIDTIKYYGKIFITTKNPYKPKIISLSNLKAKYLSKDAKILGNYQIEKLTKLIFILEKKSLVKMETLRKDFITFGTLSKTRAFGYYQMITFLLTAKNIKIITISMAIIMGIIAGFVISLTS